MKMEEEGETTHSIPGTLEVASISVKCLNLLGNNKHKEF